MVGTGGGGQVCLAMVGVTVDSPVLVGSGSTVVGDQTVEPGSPPEFPAQPSILTAAAKPNINSDRRWREDTFLVTSSKARYRQPRELMNPNSKQSLRCSSVCRQSDASPSRIANGAGPGDCPKRLEWPAFGPPAMLDRQTWVQGGLTSNVSQWSNCHVVRRNDRVPGIVLDC